jgi:hypothetical protein
VQENLEASAYSFPNKRHYQQDASANSPNQQSSGKP